MIDPTDREKSAMQKAGQLAGEYLDSIQKYDLSSLSKDEWETLIEVICTEYQQDMQVPF